MILTEKRPENSIVREEIIRDKTSTVSGAGIIPFIRHITRIMPGGNIGIIYDNSEITNKILAGLDAALYNVKLYDLNSPVAQPLPKYVKFVIAVGGVLSLETAKRFCTDSKYCYYCLIPNLDMFSDLSLAEGTKFKYPEFVYFDTLKLDIRDTKIAFGFYKTMFSLITECIMFAYYEAMYPFQNRSISGIIGSLKKILLEGVDEESFLKEYVRLLKTGVENLNKGGQKVFISSRLRDKVRLSDEKQFVCEHFINILLLYFTKWDFFDMLIPAKELISGINGERPNLRGVGQTALLNEKELNVIARKAFCVTDLPYADIKENAGYLKKIIDKETPLLAEIHNRGILEGLYYGRFEKD